jgi:hypothetical protein
MHQKVKIRDVGEMRPYGRFWLNKTRARNSGRDSRATLPRYAIGRSEQIEIEAIALK